MFSSLIITLRETLEAALVVGIVLAYLKHIMNKEAVKYVWSAVVAGIVLSILLAFGFNFIGGFEGVVEEVYEGVMMILAGGLLTWMILWMFKQRASLKKNLENKVALHIDGGNYWGVFALVLASIAREGIETVIFLQAALIQSDGSSVLVGAVSGIVIAIVMSVLLFKGIAKVPLRKFFTFSSVLLIMFAAGLFAHGVHEFQEAGLIPVVVEHVWDMNPAVVSEGVYPIMHEKGVIGSLLKGLFGYNGNPNLLEVITYFLYLAVITVVWRSIDKTAGVKKVKA